MNYEMKALGDVFQNIQRGRGFGETMASDGERNRLVSLINDAGKYAWKKRMWPDLVCFERRTYRPPWSEETQYVVGQQVWREAAETVNGVEGHYYQAEQGNIGVDPLTDDGTNWTVDPWDLTLYIAFDQPWESTPIDGVEVDRFATWDNPMFVREPNWVKGCWLNQRAVIFPAPSQGPDQGTNRTGGSARGMPAKPWIRYRPPWPKVSATLWSVGTTYAAGDLCYRAETKECYVALLPSTGKTPENESEYWQARGVPEFLAPYIERWATGQRMAEDEGKYKVLQEAENILEQLESQAMEDTGMQESVGFVGR